MFKILGEFAQNNNNEGKLVFWGYAKLMVFVC